MSKTSPGTILHTRFFRFRLSALLMFSVSAALPGIAPAQSTLTTAANALPDAPDTLLSAASVDGPGQSQSSEPSLPSEQSPGPQSPRRTSAAGLPPCPRMDWGFKMRENARPGVPECRENPLQMVVTTRAVQPLTSKQKGELAIHNFIDPFNVLTITGYAAIYVAAESHSPYGPGFKGWGRYSGYSFAEDAQGQFFGVYAIPSLAHEDPRYHRLPDHSIKVRLIHALGHTLISQHDDGSLMPNYAVLLSYPIDTELSNAYVPGISTTGSSTRNRILLGYATNPACDLIAEFLPDIAKRVHIRVVFVQQILNNIATRSGNQ